MILAELFRFFGRFEANVQDANRKRLAPHFRRLYLLTIVVALFPVFTVNIPPLVDYPNHLARDYIIANVDEVPIFKETFKVVYQPIPNVAMELITVPLTPYLGIEVVGRLFILLTIVSFAIGCFMLASIPAPQGAYVPIFVVFFYFGFTLFYGFLNYLLGISVFLITFGLWLRWRSEMKPFRISILIALTFLAYIAHLSSVAFLALAIGVVRLLDIAMRGLNVERCKLVLLDAIPFISPLVLFLTFMSGSGQLGTLEWGTLGGKMAGFLGPFRSFNTPLDLIWVLSLTGAFIIIVRYGNPRVESSLFLSGTVFLMLFIFAPTTLFTVTFADIRIVLPGLVLIALSFSASELPKWKNIALLLLFGVILTRQASIAHGWSQVDVAVNEQRKLLDKVVPGSQIYPIFVHGAGQEFERFEHPMEFVALYATIQRHSVLPTLYAIKGQQPLNFGDPKQRFIPAESPELSTLRVTLESYDYVWAYGVDEQVKDHLKGYAELVGAKGKTTIWKLR